MSQAYVSMAMSLDGFITGPHDDAQNPAGINGMRLMDWLAGGGSDASGVDAFRPRDLNSQIVFDEMLATGAVITGKRTGDFAGYWGGDHHNGVPIFVPTHQPPAENPFEQVLYVTDGIAACVQQAKAAAGDRDVFIARRLHRPAGPQGWGARRLGDPAAADAARPGPPAVRRPSA
jgi:dihydrofolate reductase